MTGLEIFRQLCKVLFDVCHSGLDPESSTF